MWRLAALTPIEWAERVAERPLELLRDHAYCELRAAASAQSLLGKHVDKPRLVSTLCEVARDELAHFAAVVNELEVRGAKLTPVGANPYTAGLLACTRHGQEELLLERLLVSSLIEARSLERFHLLSEHLADRALAEFYRSLLKTEAEHQALFVTLAREFYDAERVRVRLAELRVDEARVLATLPFDYRMHSGLAVRATTDAEPASASAAR